MTPYTSIERADFYKKAFPTFPPLRADTRWLDGIWVLGNDYRGNGYYGAYPPTYLKRILSLFPDAKKILHLFSGSLMPGNYSRFDRPNIMQYKTDKDFCGDAHNLSTIVGEKSFDLVLADPPYSQEDAEHYGCSLIKRNIVFEECRKTLITGGYLIWLDQVLPMFRKDELHLFGLIGIVRSTNHRFRLVSIFRKW